MDLCALHRHGWSISALAGGSRSTAARWPGGAPDGPRAYPSRAPKHPLTPAQLGHIERRLLVCRCCGPPTCTASCNVSSDTRAIRPSATNCDRCARRGRRSGGALRDRRWSADVGGLEAPRPLATRRGDGPVARARGRAGSRLFGGAPLQNPHSWTDLGKGSYGARRFTSHTSEAGPSYPHRRFSSRGVRPVTRTVSHAPAKATALISRTIPTARSGR